MKSIKSVGKASSAFFASTVGVALFFMIVTAAVASWKPREKFTDCSMTASCSL